MSETDLKPRQEKPEAEKKKSPAFAILAMGVAAGAFLTSRIFKRGGVEL